MMAIRRVRFIGFAHTRTYASATQRSWEPGEVREVEEAEAARLLQDFGSAFSIEGVAPVRAVIEGAPIVKAPTEAPTKVPVSTKRKRSTSKK